MSTALEGATESDIHAIKQAKEMRSAARVSIASSHAAISAVGTATNRVTQIVIRPLKSPEFGSGLAVGKAPVTQVSESIRKRSGGEGGIARGYAARPSLTFGTAVAKSLRRPAPTLRVVLSNPRKRR
jgi:hypothetical protein